MSRQLYRWGAIPILGTLLIASATQSWMTSRSEHRRLESRLGNNQSKWEQAILKSDYIQLRQEIQSMVSSEGWSCGALLDDTSTVVASYPRLDWVGLTADKIDCSGFSWRLPITSRKDGSLIWAESSISTSLKLILTGLLVSALSLVVMLLLMKRLSRELNDYTARVSAEIDSLHGRKHAFESLSMSQTIDHELREIQIIREAVDRLRLQNEALAKTRELNAAADARARLAQQVAHDIRSPLSAMNALLSISENLPEEEALLLKGAANRVKEIADDLLRVRRAESDMRIEHHEDAKVGELLHRIILEAKLVYRERQLLFSLKVEGDVAEIGAPVSATELSRAISNLLNNAAESIDDPGAITIKLCSENDLVVISVSDTGSGIPEHIREKLGMAGFSFGKPEGNGLGLHQVMAFAKNAGGRVEIQSVENQGTTVSLFLPIS